MRSDVIAFISTDALVHNIRALRACCAAGVRFCAPLKADAYGHGMETAAPAASAAGAEFAAVATVQEAIELRRLVWAPPILILGNVLAVADDAERGERLAAAATHDLTLTVADESTAETLAGHSPGETITAHLKIDTGMGRMGVMPDRARDVVRRIRRMPDVELTGVYSHFATADFEAPDTAMQQLRAFRDALDALKTELPSGVIRHLANSAATIALPESHFDMVRPGLAMYGYAPSPHLADRVDLRPALRLVSHLTAVKDLPPGHGVGYGRTFVTRRPTRMGIIPIGYFDGFLRILSNGAVVGTAIGDAPIIGRISMDQLAVDLTDLGDLPIGSSVTLIDERPARPNSVAAIARRMQTIPYEVTCLIGPRVDRVAVGQFCAAESPDGAALDGGAAPIAPHPPGRPPGRDPFQRPKKPAISATASS